MESLLENYAGLELFTAPKLGYLLLTFVVVLLGQLFEGSYQKGRREHLTNHQRDLYHQKLAQDSLEMEKEQLQSQLEVISRIRELQDQSEWSKKVLSELQESESEESCDEEQLSNGRSSTTSSGSPSRTKSAQLYQELELKRDKANQLVALDSDIGKMSASIGYNDNSCQAGSCSTSHDALIKSLESLSTKVKELELENDRLKLELEGQPKLKLINSKTKLDPSLVEYMTQHQDQITLPFLKKAHETLIELKASNPDKDFTDFILQLRDGHKNRITQLTELQVRQKEAEIKLQIMKRRYDEELGSFNELKIEHLLKNSGAKEFLDSIKEKNRMKDSIIRDLKSKIEMRQRDLEVWQSKYKTVEEQCNKYREEWRKSQITRDQMESEFRAKQEHERRILNHSINMSSASSMIDNQIPPPPDIDIPSVADLILASKSMGDMSFASSHHGFP